MLILFVCTGNICRSAFAEACLRARLAPGSAVGGRPADVEVGSAGIAAVTGGAMDRPMALEAGRLGIDPTGHRARQLTGRILKDSGLVLVFGAEHVDWIAAEFPEHLGKVLSLGQAAAALTSGPRRAQVLPEEIASTVRDRRPEPQPQDWIVDPYRKGKTVVRAVADRIFADVTALVDRVDWHG